MFPKAGAQDKEKTQSFPSVRVTDCVHRGDCRQQCVGWQVGHKLWSTEQQPAASEGWLKLQVGESVLNVLRGWWTNPKKCGLVPTFGYQMMAEYTK